MVAKAKAAPTMGQKRTVTKGGASKSAAKCATPRKSKATQPSKQEEMDDIPATQPRKELDDLDELLSDTESTTASSRGRLNSFCSDCSSHEAALQQLYEERSKASPDRYSA